ncbi:MAG: PIN domain-containing protein [Nitrospinaceae bacterium]|nr:PIN domain-containing protein [Nitrospinaceae bacterium]
MVDTSVFVSALRSARGKNRAVLRLCLTGECEPLMGTSLFFEFEDVTKREKLFRDCPISQKDRETLFHAFLSVCRWTHVYYLWRPNLPDEADNQVLELALAGGARALVTNNIKHFKRGELLFPEIEILRPGEFVQEVT